MPRTEEPPLPNTQRRSYETGHRPKFLVIIDGTPECNRAIHFAARRAARTGSGLCMISFVAKPDNFEWLGIGEAIRAEAEAEAEDRLEAAAGEARRAVGLDPEKVIRHGDKVQEILKLIEEDSDISFLVLAAGTNKEGPGPLVSGIGSKLAATFPIPIIIVPGTLTDEEIDALAG